MKRDIITGIGFFTALIGFAGLAEAFQGNGRSDVAMGIIAAGILILASQTVGEWIDENKKDRDFNASYPCYLDYKRKRR